MSVAIIPDFVKYQIDWLTSHKDLEFEPVIEDAIIQMLKDTGKSFIDEQAVETSQFDHIAESDRKVSIPCAHENDVISRKAAIDAVEKSMYENPHENEIHRGMHDHEHRHFLTILMGLPSAQPATNCSEIPNSSDDTISRQAAIDALADMHCKSDEDGYVWIIRSDAWARIDALPSAQPELEKKIKEIGYTGKEGQIYIGGRLFGVRELAQ